MHLGTHTLLTKTGVGGAGFKEINSRGVSCSVVSDSFATPQTVPCQGPLSMGFSRHEYWSGLPWPSPGDLPDPGIKPASHTDPWHLHLKPLFLLPHPQGTTAHVSIHELVSVYLPIVFENLSLASYA